MQSIEHYEKGKRLQHEHGRGIANCALCKLEHKAARRSGQRWEAWVKQLIPKLGFSPRFPSVSDVAHLRELLGPEGYTDAKTMWARSLTVEGYLSCRPGIVAAVPYNRREGLKSLESLVPLLEALDKAVEENLGAPKQVRAEAYALATLLLAYSAWKHGR